MSKREDKLKKQFTKYRQIVTEFVIANKELLICPGSASPPILKPADDNVIVMSFVIVIRYFSETYFFLVISDSKI